MTFGTTLRGGAGYQGRTELLISLYQGRLGYGKSLKTDVAINIIKP